MTAIALPSAPSPSDAVPRLLDFGGELAPPFGGATQRLDRLGSRYAIDVQMPPMPAEPTGRIWVSRLKRAKQGRVLLKFPQPNLKIGVPGSPLVRTTTAGGTTVPIKGLTPRYPIREGQFFSIIHSSQRYLVSADSEVIADASGNADVTVTPMLRTGITVNDVIEMAVPYIEGFIEGDELGWGLNTARHVGLAFSVVESE